jgi:hypothetical protein
MSSLVDLIRANAAAIEALDRRIDETLAHRERSPADRQAWASACEAFHQGLEALSFPGGAERWEAFLLGDASGMETAISFLEAHPRFFRSGYMSEIIWHRLKRANLTARQQARIESVALGYPHRIANRQFWAMGRCMRWRGSPEFWEALAALADDHSRPAGNRAHWLLLARENHPVQRWVYREWLRAKYQDGYVPTYRFR